MACGPKRDSAAGRAGSGRTLSLSPARTGEGDAPDRRDPLGSETGRGGYGAGPERAGSGETGRRGTGWRGEIAGLETGRGNEKKKGRMGWAERVRGKRRVFPNSEKVSNTFNSNSNSKI